jgi:hypothetical protein
MLFSVRTSHSRHVPFLSELPLQQTSARRRLATFGTLLAVGCALACYQDKPAPRADSSRSGASASLGLQPVPATHDTAIREVDAFLLTSDGLQRLAAAKRNVDALYARDPGVDKRIKGASSPKSLDEMAARIDAEPEMRDALKRAGLSARNYMLTMIALQQAIRGNQLKQMGKLDMGRVPPSLMANIDYVSTHMPQIMQAMGAPAPAAQSPAP